MKSLLCLIVSLVTSITALCQKESGFQITPVDQGLYHMYYDSSGSKSTILEFENFIVMLEAPVMEDGATRLTDHVYAGELTLQKLKEKFPNKPLKYLLHSHWHPHSIASVRPFLRNHVTLVSTRSNFEKMKEFINEEDIRKFQKNITFVEGDSMVIQDKKNKVVAYRFLKTDFPSAPTEEYLYFFMPKYKAFHAGCMFFRYPQQVGGQDIIADRVKDLNRFLDAKKINPSSFMRCNADKDQTLGLIGYPVFRKLLDEGITITEMTQKYLPTNESDLLKKRDSIAEVFVRNNVPVSICNSATYSSLRKKDLQRALYLAQLQTFLSPSNPNAWDTLGETYYFMGNTLMAEYFEKQSRRIDAKFISGGINAWEKDFQQMKKQWK